MSLFHKDRDPDDALRQELLDKARFALRHFKHVHYNGQLELDKTDEKFLQSLDDDELYEFFDLFVEAVFNRPMPQPQGR